MDGPCITAVTLMIRVSSFVFYLSLVSFFSFLASPMSYSTVWIFAEWSCLRSKIAVSNHTGQ